MLGLFGQFVFYTKIQKAFMTFVNQECRTLQGMLEKKLMMPCIVLS